MIWDNSTYLWLLFLIPLFWGVFWWVRVVRNKKRQELFDDRLLSLLRLNFWRTGERVRFFSFLIAMFFFIVALAGPKIGTEIREVERSGVNMLIALDLSRSMNAEDISPSRLEKAKFEINRLVDRLEGDRVGLLVFTGEAFVQSPMTLDYSALRLYLDIAQTDQMPSSTTNFHAAMVKAEETFQSIEENSDAADVLLFIADGESHGPDYRSAVERLNQMGVTIFTVGIGTEQGGRIPIYDNGTLRGYHRDSQGQEVTTQLGAESMRNIAALGGGNYYEISRGSDTIEPFLSRLSELERGQFSSQEYANYVNRYQLMVLIGMVFLSLSLFFPDFTIRSEKNKEPAFA
ncbi:VWA domain-containing protein [Rhodohalobacter sp. SW132]|uniref:vWA domain-containing protein n=1 Tax=Rhodohalobacter sp. SW132 TaxID=2293433 RepID=UPI000E22FA47|nr:VWA domain-containing protein [Rhodohalobacter sp. SW132]REL37667.1 VWA domain-containing protein [Rhodohalobacter sp. SW132]